MNTVFFRSNFHTVVPCTTELCNTLEEVHQSCSNWSEVPLNQGYARKIGDFLVTLIPQSQGWQSGDNGTFRIGQIKADILLNNVLVKPIHDHKTDFYGSIEEALASFTWEPIENTHKHQGTAFGQFGI